MAMDLARKAEQNRAAGRPDDALRLSHGAIAIDPGCPLARICRAELLLASERRDAALAELDSAVEKGPCDRGVLVYRATLAIDARDWRKARGDLERVLSIKPALTVERQLLVGVLLELGEDDRAAAAVADTLRADPRRLPDIAADLLQQADRLEQKYPEAPSIPAGWLAKAMAASKRGEFRQALQGAADAGSDRERLAILRDRVRSLAAKK
jgi:tetratricopeptide (TPR) repeat protein